MLHSAIKNFPRWMDIRKRYFSSNGGQLLSSVSEEVALIQDEIDEYVQQFFIPYYKGKCEVIPDFIYKANIGQVGHSQIEMIAPSYDVTIDIKSFYESNDLAYYQDGFIFVRDNYERIFYMIDGFKMESTLERMHVWNVFDEFATFIGIARYENETNKELYNRIIATSQKVLNSSEEGIKNAIITSLINIVPELCIEDITLARPVAENLTAYYKEFGSVLEKLIHVNKDVLRVKSWDVDRWENGFKKIDYIPHVWDAVIDDYVNGIGDNEDLKTVLIDANTSTDMTLSFYGKSEEILDRYIENKHIEEKLNLSLMKYNNTLEPYSAKYRVTAGEAIDIERTEQDGSMMIVVYERGNDEKEIRLDSIVSKYSGIEIQRNGCLENDKYYRVKFLPKDEYSSMEIYNLEVVNEYGEIIIDENGDMLDFKREQGTYEFVNTTLLNTSVKKIVTRTSHFGKVENVADVANGITIDDISNNAELVLNIDKCNNEPLKLLYSCEMSNVLSRDITLNNFYYKKENGSYYSDVEGDEKSIVINIKANQFVAKVNQGQCMVKAVVNGSIIHNAAPGYKDGEMKYETPIYNAPQNMQITIMALGIGQVEISELLYSDYDIELTTNKGDVSSNKSDHSSFSLPSYYENNLHVRMKTRTQYAPVIRKLFIGQPMSSSDAYESDLIVGNCDYQIYVDSNCNVELYESDSPFEYCEKGNPDIKVTSGYSTGNAYVAIEDGATIYLNTEMYTSIDSIHTEEGTYEVIGTGQSAKHVIRLSADQKVTKVRIKGQYESVAAIKTIHELIQSEFDGYEPSYYDEEEEMWYIGDKLYVSNIFKCFVVEKQDGRQFKVELTKNSFNLKSDVEISKITVDNMSTLLQAAFVTVEDSINGNCTSIGAVHYGTFEKFYLFPKYSKEYVAQNEYVTYLREKDGIEIINTFNNGYAENILMAYRVEPNSNEFDITFGNGESCSIGKDTLKITLNKQSDYNITRKVVTENIKLGSTVNLKDVYTTENKESIELAQYLIDTTNADFEVMYKYDITNSDYIKAEFIDVKNDGFNKLRYSNVVAIQYLGIDIYDKNSELEQLDESTYELDKEKGIIIWKDQEFINSGSRLYIIYVIKKPISIKYNVDALYQKVQYSVSAYKEKEKIKLLDIESGKKLDLINPIVGDIELSEKIANAYRDSDCIYVECSEPGFEAEKIKDCLLINKTVETNTLAVKSGWYYMYGKEYYMFATDQSQNILEDEFVTFQEVSKREDELSLHKKTVNYIKNTKMTAGSTANTYHIDKFGELKFLKGSSNMNGLTACDTYNHWNTFAMEMSIEDGLNGSGLFFEPYSKKDIAYAFLNITDYAVENTHVSFYSPDGLKVYLGREKIITDIPLTNTMNLTSMIEVTDKDQNDIYFTSFKKEKNYKYYLIVRGQGLLDDIIIQDGNDPQIKLHKKNISALNLEIEESTASGVIKRVFFDDSLGNKGDKTEVDSQGYIVNTSNIDWNVTKIKSYSSKKDWMGSCDLKNVDVVAINDTDCMIATEKNSGKITTRPIYIGDPNTIHSIIFKINNVPLNEMQGFTVQLSQAQTSNGPFIPSKLKLNSTSSLNYTKDIFYPYVQLSVDMPQKKVIDNIEIYLEHKSTEKCSPIGRIESYGEFISKVYDSRHMVTYKLSNLVVEDADGDVSFYIRGAKKGSGLEVWTDWKEIKLENGEIKNDITFEDYRFFQMKIALNDKLSKVKLKYFDLEVIK